VSALSAIALHRTQQTITKEMSNMPYSWIDFEEDWSTDQIKDKFILTILDPEGEEFASIVHRASNEFPIDGDLAEQKRDNAQKIVDALNRS